MKEKMDNIEEFLRELNTVSEKIRKFNLELCTLKWSPCDIPSESSRECLNGVVQETKDSLYKILWKCENLNIYFIKTLAAKENDVEEWTAGIIKNALALIEKKEKEND